MRWKFALIDPDQALPDRFTGTAEEAARHALTIPIGESKYIVTASDEPLSASPDYPPGWFIRQIRKQHDSELFHVDADAYDHGSGRRNPAWLISYFVHRLRRNRAPCVFEVRAVDGTLLQVVIAEDSDAQRNI